MKYEMTAEQSAAVYQYKLAATRLMEKGTRMREEYIKFLDFIDLHQFDNAKEYLRSMPECATKALCFRTIILAEDLYKGNENDTN